MLHGKDYEEGKERVKNYKHVASALKKKGVIITYEDETTITQKPCIRKSMSFEGEQQRIEHTVVVERSSLHTYPCYGLKRN